MERSLLLLMAVQLTTGFRGGIISPLLSLFIRRQGMSISQVGLIGTASILGWLIFEPLSGVVADRVRKRWMIVFAVIGSTLVYAAYPLASRFEHFLVLYFLTSSVMSAYAISVKALTAELLPRENRGRVYGRYLAVISLGGVVAPMVGGWVTENMGYSVPFYIASGIGLVTLSAVLLMRYDDKPLGAAVSRGGSVRELLTPTLISIFLVRGMFIFDSMFTSNFLPIYLNESPRFQATETQIGVFQTLFRLATAGGQAALGGVMDRLGSSRVMVGSVSLLGVSYLALTSGGGLPLLLALGCVQGVLTAAADMSMMIHLMAVMPPSRTGMVMGLYSESENVGGLAANPALGFIYESMGGGASVLALVAVLLAASMASALMIRDPEGS
jgi:MFS family permease